MTNVDLYLQEVNEASPAAFYNVFRHSSNGPIGRCIKNYGIDGF
jgi:hypothetical protein